MELPASCTENSRGSERCAPAAAHTAVSPVRSWLAQLHPEQLFLWSAGAWIAQMSVPQEMSRSSTRWGRTPVTCRQCAGTGVAGGFQLNSLFRLQF